MVKLKVSCSLCCFLTAFALAGVPSAAAQPPDSLDVERMRDRAIRRFLRHRLDAMDTLDVRGVLVALRANNNYDPAIAFLTQEGRDHSARELDALADSLVAIATSYRRGDPPGRQGLARDARLALSLAASPQHLAERRDWLAERRAWLPEQRRDRVPVPYPRTFEALVRIVEGSREPGVRGGTRALLALLPDTARVVGYLSEVAVSATALAPTAIRHLDLDMGEAGLAALRRLYRADTVVNTMARQSLRALARHHGWNR